MPISHIYFTSLRLILIQVLNICPYLVNLQCGACTILTMTSPGAPYSIQSPIFINLIRYPLKVPAFIGTLNSQLPCMILLPLQVEHFLPIILPLPLHLGHVYVIILQYPPPTCTCFVVLPCPLHCEHLTMSYQFCAPDPKQCEHAVFLNILPIIFLPMYKSYSVNINFIQISDPFNDAIFFCCWIFGSSIFYGPKRSYKYFLPSFDSVSYAVSYTNSYLHLFFRISFSNSGFCLDGIFLIIFQMII